MEKAAKLGKEELMARTEKALAKFQLEEEAEERKSRSTMITLDLV